MYASMVSRSNQTLVLGCPDLVVPHAFHTTCSSSWIHISTCVSACTPDPRLPVDHPPEHILRFAYAESPKRRKPQGNQASYEHSRDTDNQGHSLLPTSHVIPKAARFRRLDCKEPPAPYHSEASFPCNRLATESVARLRRALSKCEVVQRSESRERVKLASILSASSGTQMPDSRMSITRRHICRRADMHNRQQAHWNLAGRLRIPTRRLFAAPATRIALLVCCA